MLNTMKPRNETPPGPSEDQDDSSSDRKLGIRHIVPFILAATVAAPAYATDVAFLEGTAASGITHIYDGGPAFFVGGGVAAFDCDNNHFPDLYFAGGENPAGLYRNVTKLGGALQFTPTDAEATALIGVAGAYPIDVDGDDFVDLFVMRVGENVLLRGQGDCRFERANELWGYDGGSSPTTAFAAVWETNRRLPTLAEGNYVDRSDDNGRLGTCQPNRLFRPNAEGEGYRPALPLDPSYCPLSMLFTDWQNAGRRDLRISNDRQYYGEGGSEQLWHLPVDEAPRAYTEDDGWQRLRIWGMGIASHDVTGDGKPDYYLTSMADNKLRASVAASTGPAFEDSAYALGVTAHRPSIGDTSKPSTSWHAEFGDVDNDGRFDLFVAKGNVEAMDGFAMEDPNALFIRRPDGTFADVAPAAGVASTARGRGAALVDLNLDGALDLVVVNRKAPAQVWRNTTPGGNWIQIKLRQADPNTDAIGARIDVVTGDRTTVREIAVGGGHAGGQLGWAHFGLGRAAEARVTVHWPDGASQTIDLPANRLAEIRRDETKPTLVDLGSKQ